MYRQYENPYELEKMLEKLKKEYDNAIKTNEDEETLIYLHFEISNLALIQFEGGGGTQIPLKRLFSNEKEAQEELKKKKSMTTENRAYKTYMYDIPENF